VTATSGENAARTRNYIASIATQKTINRTDTGGVSMTVPTAEDLSQDELEAALRRWLQSGVNDHVRAAVELLIEHGFWTRRDDFIKQAITYHPLDDEAALIRWSGAREAFEAGLRASTSELAVLDFAIALGEDRFAWTAMGTGHHAMILHAVRTATEARR
jgi:hypothetical protein